MCRLAFTHSFSRLPEQLQSLCLSVSQELSALTGSSLVTYINQIVLGVRHWARVQNLQDFLHCLNLILLDSYWSILLYFSASPHSVFSCHSFHCGQISKHHRQAECLHFGASFQRVINLIRRDQPIRSSRDHERLKQKVMSTIILQARLTLIFLHKKSLTNQVLFICTAQTNNTSTSIPNW